MTTSTHHVNQVDKLTSQLTSTIYQLVKENELFHSANVARLQVVQEAASKKEKLESDIKYINEWLMEVSQEVKDSKCTENDAVRKASKSSVIMSNRLQRLKDLKLIVGKLKEKLADKSHLRETLQKMSTICL